MLYKKENKSTAKFHLILCFIYYVRYILKISHMSEINNTNTESKSIRLDLLNKTTEKEENYNG